MLIIDREAGDIIRLVASICSSVCLEGENHSAKESEENEYAGPTCKVQHNGHLGMERITDPSSCPEK